MTTAARLRTCYRLTGAATLLILASGIQLEATAGRHEWAVWAHIALGTAWAALAARHIYLHYRSTNWFARFAANRNRITRILWWLLLLTVTSGVASTAHWAVEGGHSGIGGVHGKIGFVMAAVAAIHAARHIARCRL